jgi:hypothetical protein
VLLLSYVFDVLILLKNKFLAVLVALVNLGEAPIAQKRVDPDLVFSAYAGGDANHGSGVGLRVESSLF